MAAAGIREIKYRFDYRNDPIVAEILNGDKGQLERTVGALG